MADKTDKVIVVASPDTIGNFSIREDVTMYIDRESVKMDFVVDMMSGVEVSQRPPEYRHLPMLEVVNGKWPVGDDEDLKFYPVTAVDGIKVGDELLCPFLFGGYVIITVSEIKGNEATAETEDNFYWLHFCKDRRMCWTCWSHGSKAAVKMIEVT